MLRSAVIVSLLIAASSASALADERPRAQGEAEAADETFPPAFKRDGFVISNDACGASQYSHLVGRDFGEVTQASLLPADSVLQNRNALRTLEYRPYALNVSVNAGGRIVAIGCF